MSDVPFITVEELSEKLKAAAPPYVLDVREPHENDLCKIPGSVLIPMGELQNRIGELPKDRVIVAHCHHGGRSGRAIAFLRAQGFDQAFNLKGGIHDWSVKIDPSVKTY